MDLEKLKIANDLNNSDSSTRSTANPLACGRPNGPGEVGRRGMPGASRDGEPIKSRLNSNESCCLNINASQAVENEAEIGRSLSPELESSRKRIEKLNKLTSERSFNQRTLKARIFNYFSPARATPGCEEHRPNGVQKSVGELSQEGSSSSPTKKKTTWSSRFQKFKSKTNVCLNQIKIMFDL